VPVVASGIVASNSNAVPLNPVARTICVPLMAAASAALQSLPVSAVTPEMVTISPRTSVLVAVTVTTVVVAVTAVGVTDEEVALTWTGKCAPYAGVPRNVGVIAYR
jgi:hypothetical protein